MNTETQTKKPEAIWEKQRYDYLGSDIYKTSFPAPYSTGVSISIFPSKKILTLGEILEDSLRKFSRSLLRLENPANNKRIYAFTNSEADTKLSLNCFLEDDSVDWDANSAFFKGGKLVAVVSVADIPETDKHPDSRLDLKNLENLDLVGIYRNEFRRVVRDILNYEGEGDPYEELISILKAESPSGQGLHDSYRRNIRGILDFEIKER